MSSLAARDWVGLVGMRRLSGVRIGGWATEDKPIIITDYDADTLPRLHVAAQPRTEEYQVEYLEMNHRVFARVDAVVGEHVWNFAKFATTPGDHARRGEQDGRVHP